MASNKISINKNFVMHSRTNNSRKLRLQVHRSSTVVAAQWILFQINFLYSSSLLSLTFECARFSSTSSWRALKATAELLTQWKCLHFNYINEIWINSTAPAVEGHTNWLLVVLPAIVTSVTNVRWCKWQRDFGIMANETHRIKSVIRREWSAHQRKNAKHA